MRGCDEGGTGLCEGLGSGCRDTEGRGCSGRECGGMGLGARGCMDTGVPVLHYRIRAVPIFGVHVPRATL